MTLKHAIEILKSECYVVNFLNLDRSTMINTALDTVISAVQQMPGWIPIKNGLPEPGEMVLVSCQAKNGRSSVNRAYMDDQGFWHGSGSMSGVVAWQRLPEPYSEE